MVGLGDEVVDNVSGFRGITVAEHIYLNGCTRFSVQGKIGKDGKLPATETFDEPNLTVVKARRVRAGSRDPGGPERHMPKDRPT